MLLAPSLSLHGAAAGLDEDGDGLDDDAEADLCALPETRQLLNDTDNAGECLGPKDYVAPDRAVLLSAMTHSAVGSDTDDDGFPATVDVVLERFEVRPAIPSIERGESTEVVVLDRFDDDPSLPGEMPTYCESLRSPTAAVPADIDQDDDGYVAHLELTGGEACADRRDGSVDLNPSRRVALLEVDPDDQDPTVPSGPQVETSLTPLDADPSLDADGDTIVSHVAMGLGGAVVERDAVDPPTLRTSTETQRLDPDDTDPDRPVILSMEDTDGDWVRDGAERWICVDAFFRPSLYGSCGPSLQKGSPMAMFDPSREYQIALQGPPLQAGLL